MFKREEESSVPGPAAVVLPSLGGEGCFHQSNFSRSRFQSHPAL